MPGPRWVRGERGGSDAHEESFGLNQVAPDASLCPPNQRTTPPGGGCPDPWNFSTNQPYPPDLLTLRPSGQALGKLMAE
jgi:hypothetical protein